MTPLAELAAALGAERDAFVKFLELLRNEEAALAEGRIDDLPAIAQAKTETFIALSRLAECRDALLARLGVGGEAKAVDAWLERNASQPEAEGARTAWRQLLEAARQAKSLNEANGAMIEVKMQHNQQALAVLRAAARQMTLYGPDGQHLAVGGGRRYDKV